MTAADLLDGNLVVRVYVGAPLLSDLLSYVTVTRIVRHPDYVKGRQTANLAIFWLSTVIGAARPFGVDLIGHQFSYSARPVRIISYGAVVANEVHPNNMHSISHVITEPAFCGTLTKRDQLCTADIEGATAPCYFDRGAPVLSEDTYALLAIVTQAEHDCSGWYGKTHLMIAPYLDWIIQQL